MSPPLFSWRWLPREASATPQAAVGWGETARTLLTQLRRLPDERRLALTLVSAPDALIVAGPSRLLPWVDGVAYAAPTAGGLWLPTHLTLSLPAEWVGKALEVKFSRMPLLLWPDPDRVVPLDNLLPANDENLAHAGPEQECP